MNVTTNIWSDGPDYPFDDVNAYSSISTTESVYIIGGRGSTIAEFFNYQWFLVGNLKKHRSRHESILIGNQIYIIGNHYNGHK